MLTLVVAILAAGDMALWLGPGRKIFSALTPSADFGFAFALYGALADPAIAWGGWNILGAPGVVKMITASPSLFDAETRQFPELLARLVRVDRLEGTGEVWTEKLGAWVENRLASWKMVESDESEAEEKVEELNVLLTLSRFSPPVAIVAHLTAIIEGILGVVSEGADGSEEVNKTYANKSWVLGSAFGALAATCTRSKSDGLYVDPASWVEPTVRCFGRSEIALSGLVELVKARYVTFLIIYHRLRCSQFFICVCQAGLYFIFDPTNTHIINPSPSTTLTHVPFSPTPSRHPTIAWHPDAHKVLRSRAGRTQAMSARRRSVSRCAGCPRTSFEDWQVEPSSQRGGRRCRGRDMCSVACWYVYFLTIALG